MTKIDRLAEAHERSSQGEPVSAVKKHKHVSVGMWYHAAGAVWLWGRWRVNRDIVGVL